MSVLTDILLAPVSEAPRVLSDWPRDKRWPAVATPGLDTLVLEDLAVAMGREQLAQAIQELDPSCFDDEAQGPWIYVLPVALRDALATLAPQEVGKLAKAWSAGEEAGARGLTPLVAEGLLHALQALAVRARGEGLPMLLWMSL